MANDEYDVRMPEYRPFLSYLNYRNPQTVR